MNTAAKKHEHNLWQRLFAKVNPLEAEFERERNRSTEWMGQAFTVIVILIFAFILIVCTMWIGMSLLAGYGTVALGVIIGFEVVLTVSGILMFTLVVPTRSSQMERLHDHLDLLSSQIKTADSRVDDVVMIQASGCIGDGVLEYVAGAIKDEDADQLRAIRASCVAAIDMLDERLPHG